MHIARIGSQWHWSERTHTGHGNRLQNLRLNQLLTPSLHGLWGANIDLGTAIVCV